MSIRTKIIRTVLSVLCAATLIMCSIVVAVAHSGRTDSRGGHKDNKNASGLGSYHYHCGGYPAHLHSSGYCPYTDIFPTGVTINTTKKELCINEEVELVVEVLPSNACSTKVTFESSDESVIKISGNKIKAVGYGTAVITATSFNEKSGSLTVTVKEIAAENVTIIIQDNTGEKIYIGDSIIFTADITPSNVDNNSVTWNSTDTAVATVDGNGKVTALAAGSTDITATASNGVVGVYQLTVYEKTVENITLSKNNLELTVGQTSKLEAVIAPADATYSQVEWFVGDESVIKVDNGTVKAVGCGTTTITVKSSNGLTAVANISVSEAAEDTSNKNVIKPTDNETIKITSSRGNNLEIGEVAELKATLVSSNSVCPNVVWKSSNTEIASIDEQGNLKALSRGTVTITAMVEDGVTAEYEVTVLMSDSTALGVVGCLAVIGVGIFLAVKKKLRKKA